MSSLPVEEIFLSIQGEGKQVGAPTLFVRVHGCSRWCGYCDTGYTYKGAKTPNPPPFTYYLPDLMELVRKSLISTPYADICFTGGEPMLYFPFIQLFKKTLVNAWDLWPLPPFSHWTVESCGELHRKPEHLALFENTTISPKLGSSGRSSKLNYGTLHYLALLTGKEEAVTFKFVISHEADFMEMVEEVLKIRRSGFHTPIYLQPADPVLNWSQLWDLYLKHRTLIDGTVRVLPQIHKLVSMP